MSHADFASSAHGADATWGTISRFDQRDTGKEPSKSGVIGLLAAALGVLTGKTGMTWNRLLGCRWGFGTTGPVFQKRDYQTSGCAANDTIIKADAAIKDGVASDRHYLPTQLSLLGSKA